MVLKLKAAFLCHLIIIKTFNMTGAALLDVNFTFVNTSLPLPIPLSKIFYDEDQNIEYDRSSGPARGRA